MNRIAILFLVTLVEVGELGKFNLEELSEIWAALTVCRDDRKLFGEFSTKEKKDVIAAIEKVETELRHRHKEPVNFFQLMQDNPEKVEFYLSKFTLQQLFELEKELKDFKKSKIVVDFLKLVKKQIYRRVPVS